MGADIEFLSARENEILKLIANGVDNVDIAKRLFISYTTVKNHVTKILQKLEVANRTEAAAYYWHRHIKTRYVIIDWTDKHTEILAEKYHAELSVEEISKDMDLPACIIKEKLKICGFVS